MCAHHVAPNWEYGSLEWSPTWFAWVEGVEVGKFKPFKMNTCPIYEMFSNFTWKRVGPIARLNTLLIKWLMNMINNMQDFINYIMNDMPNLLAGLTHFIVTLKAIYMHEHSFWAPHIFIRWGPLWVPLLPFMGSLTETLEGAGLNKSTAFFYANFLWHDSIPLNYNCRNFCRK